MTKTTHSNVTAAVDAPASLIWPSRM